MDIKNILLFGALYGLFFSFLSSGAFAFQLFKKKHLGKFDSYMLTWIPVPIAIVLYFLIFDTALASGRNLMPVLLITFSCILVLLFFLFYKYEQYLTKTKKLEESSKAVLFTTVIACALQMTLVVALLYLLFVEAIA